MAWFEQIYFGNTLLQYLIALGIICASFLVAKTALWISKTYIKSIAKKTKTQIDDILIEAGEGPVTFLMIILGFYIAYNYLIVPEGSVIILGNVVKILVAIDIGWFLLKFIDSLLVSYIQPLSQRTATQLDDHLLPFIRQLVKFVIISVTIVVVLDNAGYDITTIVAGLGIGGLAFALAAKDILSNIFGGVTVIVDKPFTIGDRIRIDKWDGKVKEIRMRSTRIETIDGSQLIVPNANITASYIENVTREEHRRIKNVLGLEYNTSANKLEEAKKIIDNVLNMTQGVEHETKKYKIAFMEFGASSLNITVLYWIRDITNAEIIQDKINMEIKKRFEKAGIIFAYPTQSVYVKRIKRSKKQ